MSNQVVPIVDRVVPLVDRVIPIVDRLRANNARGIGVVAVLALWLLRRVPAVRFPIRIVLFLSRVLPVSVWLLRYFDRRRAAAPTPDRRAAQRASARSR